MNIRQKVQLSFSIITLACLISSAGNIFLSEKAQTIFSSVDQSNSTEVEMASKLLYVALDTRDALSSLHIKAANVHSIRSAESRIQDFNKHFGYFHDLAIKATQAGVDLASMDRDEMERSGKLEEIKNLVLIQETWNEYYDSTQDYIAALRNDQEDSNAAYLKSENIFVEHFFPIFREYHQDVGKELAQRTIAVRASLRSAEIWIMLGAAFILLIAAFFIHFLLSSVVTPVKDLSEAAEKITRGEFDVLVPIRREDELGGLSRAFNHMTEELKANTAYLDSIVRSMANFLIVLDKDHKIARVNEATLELLDYKESQVTGRPKEYILLFEDQEQGEAFDAAIQSPHGEQLECALLTSTSNKIPVILSVATMQTSYGQEGIVCVGQDITHRKRTQEKLERAKETAERESFSKSQFLASMSREIRTPMNGVLGMLEVLMQSRLDPEQLDCARSARNSADSLLVVLGDILDLSKIETDRFVLENVPFNLRLLMEEAMDIVRAQAHLKKLQLSLDIDPGLWEHRIGDPLRLKQILINLLTNAVKFTAKGSVILRLFNDESYGDDGICIEVEDTGIGLPEAEKYRIYQAFSHPEKAGTIKFGGSSLGLHITTQLVWMMQGRIQVESTLRKGSVFKISLPIHIQETPEATSDTTPPFLDATAPDLGIAGRGTFKILVAEDNDVNCKVIRRLLRILGLNCDIVHDGVEAVHMAGRIDYDIIFMDCQMPEMDGYKASSLIREFSKPRHPWIIALTASALKGDRERCLESGMNDYLAKPVHRDKLRRAIEAMPQEETHKHF